MINKKYPVIDRLISVLDKFKDFFPYLIQPLILDLAICYWKIQNNIDEAIKYFLQAVEINPEARCLTSYFDFMNITENRNIFNILEKIIIPKINDPHSRFRENTVQRIHKLKEYTDNYYASQDLFTTQNAFTQLQNDN